MIDAAQREVGEHFLVGPIAYGCWRLTTGSVAEASEIVETAVDHGMNLFDVADVYGLDHGGSGFGAAEDMLGRVLAASPTLRQRIVLATKAGIVPGRPYDSSSLHLREACEASLRRLRTDHIDLLQLHRPDLFVHPGEVADALMSLREHGKIREIGVSNHRPSQVQALQAHLPVELVTTQPEYSAVHLDPLRDGTFDHVMEIGLTALAWSPLAGGRLAPGAPAGAGVRAELLDVLDRLAGREGVDRAVIALAFVLAHPASPVPIIGTQRPERIRAAIAALHVHLDRDDLYAIVQASDGAPLP